MRGCSEGQGSECAGHPLAHGHVNSADMQGKCKCIGTGLMVPAIARTATAARAARTLALPSPALNAVIALGPRAPHGTPPGDLGGCEGKQLMRLRNETAQSIWVTPWGLTRKHPHVWWPGCHRPGQDIVIPVLANANGMLMTPLNPKVGRPRGWYLALAVAARVALRGLSRCSLGAVWYDTPNV